MGLKKRSWTSQAGTPGDYIECNITMACAENGEAKHHPRTCGPCARTEAGWVGGYYGCRISGSCFRINGLEEMVYRMV